MTRTAPFALAAALLLSLAVPVQARPVVADATAADATATDAAAADAAVAEALRALPVQEMGVGAEHAADPGPLGFAQDPHFHAGRLVFSFRGDLWMVDGSGANPRQLTRHQARDTGPRFSPDGRWIAFTSNRMGNNDVWVIPAEGGEPAQLTAHSGGDQVVTWTPDSRRVVFSSGRGSLQWESELYTVSLDGDLPVRLPLGAAVDGTFSSDGRLFAFNRNRYPDPKRHYRGSAAASVWVADLAAAQQDGELPDFRQLTNVRLEAYQEHAHDASPMFGADGWIYFMSERGGVFNLWRVRPDGGEPAQVTSHARGGVRFPSISPDGRTIAYSNEFDLWLYEVGSPEPRRLAIDLGWVVRTNQVEFVSVSNQADDFHPSPRGDYMVVDHRGEIFVVPAEEGVGETSRITESAWRQRGALYSPDGRYLAYISDESGDEEIWVHELATGERRRLTTQASKKSLDQWSPDSERIFFSAETTLYALDVASGTFSDVAQNRAGGYTLTQVSQDGQWLVMHRSDDHQNVDVHLYNLAERREYNLTDHPARDWAGLLTPDGSHLLFLSNRDGGRAQVYSVALTPPAEDPDDPRVRERRAREAGDGAGSGGGGGGGGGGSGGAGGGSGSGSGAGSGAAAAAGGDGQAQAQAQAQAQGQAQGQGRGAGAGAASGRGAPASVPVPDLDDIRRRAVQLTTGDAAVASFFLSNDGRTVYFVAGAGQQRALHAMDVDGRNQRRVAEGPFTDLKVTADGRTVFFREGNAIHRMPLASRSKSQVRFQLSFVVDKREEWRQMFDELYRHWKYSYVEEDMFGLDWDQVRARYEPLVERIGETADFYALAAEMLHEVPSSHSGISAPSGGGGGGGGGAGGGNQTRLLGFDLEPDARGLRVAYVYRDGPADRAWLDLEVGDYVLALNGTPVGPADNYWKLLNNLLNEYVTVTVADTPEGGGRRELRIRSVTNLNNIAYEDWVARNRELVDRESGGRIHYVHIRSMNQASLERFQQELDENFYRQGIVIDVRFNGGGNIDQQLMDILQRRPYQYTWTRTGSPVTGRRPQQIIVGPQVMMTNWRSGSNAEMVPHAFRHLELGTLVGTPTNGAVVSASQFPLKDGGSVRIPRVRVVSYDPEQPYNFGFNLENYGVPPDIWIRNTPEDDLNRHDRELRAALDEALRLLGTRRWQYVNEQQDTGQGGSGGGGGGR